MKTQEQSTILLKLLADVSDVEKNVAKVQSVLGKLKLPPSLSANFEKTFKKLEEGVTKFKAELKGDFTKQSDVTKLNTTVKSINTAFENLTKDISKIQDLKIEDIFQIPPETKAEIDGITRKIADLQEQVKKISVEPLKKFTSELSKIKTEGAKAAGVIAQQQAESGDYTAALNTVNAALVKQQQIQKQLEGQKKSTTNVVANIAALTQMKNSLQEIINSTNQLNININNLEAQKATKVAEAMGKAETEITECNNSAKQTSTTFSEIGRSAVTAASGVQSLSSEVEMATRHMQQFFTISNGIELFKRALRSAGETVQELDKAMTEIAVVSDFSVGDMWGELPVFTDNANELGVSILSAYEATTLYVQQGLKMRESIELSNETLKMARIAGMEAVDTTNAMTAALRGFNMELNEASGRRVNDVYSELAKITAADTSEISTAMSKTASIANSANMEFETTSALLSQIIETTREAPETAGTALKTIIARFQELKKAPSEIGEVDGEIIDANKIEGALRTIGVALRDTNGQFRDLDDVFLEIASKWDTLDTNTQRYIATMAAGSRQQSRFIAMMSNYDRTVELVGAAYNSSGSSQEQFEKTLDSLESKLQQLKNAWDEFTMRILNSSLIKFFVDLATTVLSTVNKITSSLGSIGGALANLLLGFLAFSGAKKIVTSLTGGIAKTFSKEFSKAGTESGNSFIKNFITSIRSGGLKNAVAEIRNSINTSLFGKVMDPNLAAYNKSLIDVANSEERVATTSAVLEAAKRKSAQASYQASIANKKLAGADKALFKTRELLAKTNEDIIKAQKTGATSSKKYLGLLEKQAMLTKKASAIEKQVVIQKNAVAQANSSVATTSELVARAEAVNTAATNANVIANQNKVAALTQWGATLKLTNAQQVEANGLSALGVASGLAEAAAMGGLTAAKMADLKAQMIANGLSKDEINSRMTNIVTMYAETAAKNAENAAGKKGLVTKISEVAVRLLNAIGITAETGGLWGKVSALLAETAAQEASNAAKLASLGIIGLIILAIIALIALIVLLAKAIASTTDAAKIKALQEQIAELGTAFEDAKNRLQELTDARSGLDDMQTKIGELTKGTQEWKKAIIENNQEVLRLLNTYDGLKLGERGENGELTIDESSWDAVIKQQEDAVLAMQTAQMQARMQLRNFEEKDLSKNIQNAQWKGREERSASSPLASSLKVQEHINVFSDTMAILAPLVGAPLKKLEETSDEAAKTLANTDVVKNIDSFISNAEESTANWAEETRNSAQELSNEIHENAKNSNNIVVKIFGSIDSAIVNLGGRFKAASGQTIGKITTGIGNIIGGVNNFVTRAATDIGDFGAGVTSSIGNWVNNAIEDVARWFGFIDENEEIFEETDLRGDRERKRNGGFTNAELQNVYASIVEEGLTLEGHGAEAIEDFLEAEYGDIEGFDLNTVMTSINNMGDSFDALALQAFQLAEAEEQATRATLASISASNDIVSGSGFAETVENVLYNSELGNYDALVEENMDKVEGTKKEQRKRYAKMMGYTYDEGSDKIYTDSSQTSEVEISDDSVKRALASVMANEQIGDRMETIASSIKNITDLNEREAAVALLSQDGSSITNKQIDQYLSDGNFNLDAFAQSMNFENAEALAAEWGISVEQLTEMITDNMEQAKDRVIKQRTKVAKDMKRLNKFSKMDDASLASTIADLEERFDSEFSSIYSSIQSTLNSFGDEGFSTEFLDGLLTEVTKIGSTISLDDLKEIDKMVNSIDFSNPIQATEQLEKVTRSGTKAQKEYAQKMLDSEAALLSASSKISYLWNSESFEDGRKSIEEIIEAEGEISSANVRELAEDCDDLADLMEQTGASTKGLAKAFTLLAEGEIIMEALTDGVLAAIGTIDSATDFLYNTVEKYANLDFGINEDEIEEVFVDAAETFKEHLEEGEYGNSETRQIAKTFLGDDIYKDENGNNLFGEVYFDRQDEISTILNKIAENPLYGFEQLAQGKDIYGNDSTSRALSNAGISITGNAQEGFTLEGYQEFFESGGTYKELVSKIAEALDITEIAAEGFLTMYSNFSDLQQYQEQYQLTEMVNAYAGEKDPNSEGKIYIDDVELEAMAKVAGVSKEDIEAEFAAQGIEIEVTAWYDENGLFKTGKALQEQLSQIVTDKSFAIENEEVIDLKGFRQELEETGRTATEVEAAVDEVLSNGLKGIKEIQYEASNGGTFTFNVDEVNVEEEIAKIEEQIDDTNLANAIAEAMGEIEITIVYTEETQTATSEATSDVTAIGTAAETSSGQINTLNDSITNTGTVAEQSKDKIDDYATSIKNIPTTKTTTITQKYVTSGGGGSAASGNAFANGNSNLESNEALVGELGPEIVVDPHSGRWYTVGDHGAEMVTLPKDAIVFNHKQTEGILNNGHIFGRGKALATGNAFAGPVTKPWEDVPGRGNNKTDGGKSSSNDDSIWENPYDKFYNLIDSIEVSTRKISKYNRQIEQLQKEQNEILNAFDLKKNITAQIETAKTTAQEIRNNYARQGALASGKAQELQSTMNINSHLRDYAYYDPSNERIYLNNSAIEANTDEERGEEIEDYISKLEDLRGQMWDAQDSQDDLEDQLEDLKDSMEEMLENLRQAYFEFEERLLEAVVNQRQAEIDALEESYELLNSSNERILNSIQEIISEQRKAREMQEARDSLEEKRQRLALLQRDTSGANQLEIIALQDEIDNDTVSYTDSLVDQAIEQMTQADEKAQEQRAEQIELLNHQLEWEKENGKFWNKVNELFIGAIDENGNLNNNSELVKLLQETEGFRGMSELAKGEWVKDLSLAVAQAYAGLQEIKNPTDVDAALGGIQGGNAGNPNGIFGNTSSTGSGWFAKLAPAAKRPTGSMSKEEVTWLQKGLNAAGFNCGKEDGVYGSKTIKAVKSLQSAVGVKQDGWYGQDTHQAVMASKYNRYETGGIVKYTGPAWLDGSPSKPEIVLNPVDSENFIKLRDILRTLNLDTNSQENNGDTYYEVHIEVESISSDYDVDQMAEKVKRIINDDARYRNNNTINLMRG